MRQKDGKRPDAQEIGLGYLRELSDLVEVSIKNMRFSELFTNLVTSKDIVDARKEMQKFLADDEIIWEKLVATEKVAKRFQNEFDAITDKFDLTKMYSKKEWDRIESAIINAKIKVVKGALEAEKRL